jgi:hypothetical protein
MGHKEQSGMQNNEKKALGKYVNPRPDIYMYFTTGNTTRGHSSRLLGF